MARSEDEQIAHIIKYLQMQPQAGPYFQKLVEWLEVRLAERRAANDELEGIPLYRSQGRAQELREIINHIGIASDLVVKMNTRK